MRNPVADALHVCIYSIYTQDDAMHIHTHYTIHKEEIAAKKELEYSS